ncbi:MAG: polysaccharide deacetylase family protein [Candidatus Saccharibacteria bacterium]|nr:polysaccharide deacetylase family protein [Candidatus Saccharibacteria bacterium]
MKKQQGKAKGGSKKSEIFLTIFLTITIFASITCSAIFALKPEFDTLGFLLSRFVDYGSEYQADYGRVCYGTIFGCEKITPEYDDVAVDTKTLGQQDIIFSFKHNDESIELKQTVFVVDKTAPMITVEKEEATICPGGKIANFGLKVEDDYDGELTEKATINYHEEDQKVIISVLDSNENSATYILPAKSGDTEPPVITLNGEEHVSIYQNNWYGDAGATVVDNCDEVELVTTGSVNTNAVGTYEITYSATDNSGNAASVKRTVEVKQPQRASGTIYLTFDDGPGQYTARLLDILKKYNVKATFFVTGKGDDSLILREYNEGHTVALHTFSHDYGYVYQSEKNYFDDLYRIQDRVKRITGVAPTLIRFPGGSSNTISANYDGGQRIMSKLVKSVQEKGFTYFDWNISSGDAGGATTSDAVFNNVVRSLKNGGSSVVLQHDIKGFSVDAVERIIQYALNRGYTFAPLTASSFAAHHGVNN